MATTKAVATVSLVITVRWYRCSQSIAGRLLAPSARRPRADGNGLTNPPCRTEPPKVPSGTTSSPHTVPLLGRPPPPPHRSSPREAPTPRPRMTNPAVSVLLEQPVLAAADSPAPPGFRGAREPAGSRVLPAPEAPLGRQEPITPASGAGDASSWLYVASDP
ncbi:hypothetical protein GCM10009654_43020 [Streptomyces hebeiensis]|uniref:Uncharacterized protein n=1 Tax=Streptomyces hebeiensis TaxID=229486 RepID=A0ABN1UYB4_9ACTN